MRTMLFAPMVVAASVLACQQPHVQSSTHVHERVREAFKRLTEAGNDWRAARAACNELASIGEPALDAVCDGAEDHEDVEVRRACYELLTDEFAHHERAIETAAQEGLTDPDHRIQYVCAFQLGEHKYFPAHAKLRRLLENPESDEHARIAAAKSLAQLGEADVIRALYEAVGSDWYMPRSMGNRGLKGLTGKDLNDFEGYDFSEGAFVSGGVEARGTFDAIEFSERRAKRYRAMELYFRWLKAERPEIYKHVSSAISVYDPGPRDK